MAALATASIAQPLPHYPAQVDSVDVDGRTIAYVDRGDGPALLFVHGLGSNLSLWREHLDAFTASHRVLALDLPGYGLSGKEDVPGSMGFFADAIAGFLDALDVDRVTYVGVSMGGQIGLTMALRHPERIDRMALVSPAGIEAFSEKDAAAITSMMTPEAIRATPDARVAQNVKLNFATYSDEHAWLIEQRHAVAARDDFDAYAAANAASVRGMLDGPVLDRLDSLDLPTLILFGAGDKLIPNRFLHPDQTPASVAEDARQALPDADVRLIDDAGHLLMLERPAVFESALRDFLG